jgi:hypothetical protein
VPGNSWTPSSPPTGARRGHDMGASVGVHTARGWHAPVRASLRWSLSSLSLVDRFRDGTHPLAARTCEPRPLTQARQIRPPRPTSAASWPNSGRCGKAWRPQDRGSSLGRRVGLVWPGRRPRRGIGAAGGAVPS